MLVAGVMLLTIFEGALRKWAFASNPALRYAAYFSKDFLFFYVGYLGIRRRALFDTSWLFLCAVPIIVPSAGATIMSSNPVGVFLSLRAYLLIPACAYLAAALVRDFRDVERCAIVVALCAMGVATLSAYQYSLPATHVLNRYDSGGEEIHIVATAGHVRATGTFAYISGMAMFAGFSAWAGTLLALPLSGRPAWIRIVGLGGLIAGFVCSATSMSRGGLMFWAVTLIGGCLLYFRPRQIFAFLVVLLFVSPFLSSGNEEVSGDVPVRSDSLFSGIAYRIERGDAIIDRAGYMLQNLYFGISRHPLGEGLGTGQPGGRYAASGQREGQWYESEWGRIAFEIGPIGLAAVLFIRFATCRRFWLELLRRTDDRTRLVLAVSLPYFGIMSLGWMAFNHTGSSFAWSVVTLALGAAYAYGRSDERAAAHFAMATPTSTSRLALK